MNAPHSPNTTTPLTHAAPSRQHPLLIAAAIAVILFCLVGTAAIMGWIPSSLGGNAGKTELSEFDKAALASKLAQDSTPLPPAQLAQNSAALPAQRFAEVERDEPRNAAASNNNSNSNSNSYPAPVARKPAQPVQVAEAPSRNWCSNCGNIESVREITHRAQGSGLGAAGGAVLGGLLGNQIGGGHGRQLATVAGAVGGAVVGNQVEGNMKATRSYEIRVRLDDGSARSFNQQSAAGWRSGDRVRIVNGGLRPVR